jgi:hypothetical protein
MLLHGCQDEYDDGDACKASISIVVGPDDTKPKYSCRKQYHAMVKLMDDILASLVERLRSTAYGITH